MKNIPQQQTFTTIGEFIRTRRIGMGMTQQGLATNLGWESPQFVSNIERDEATLPPDRVRQLAKILKVRPQQIIDLHVQAYRDSYASKVWQKAQAADSARSKTVIRRNLPRAR